MYFLSSEPLESTIKASPAGPDIPEAIEVMAIAKNTTITDSNKGVLSKNMVNTAKSRTISLIIMTFFLPKWSDQ
ncbi:hypothetical protein D3C76_1055990 [compost metagenome]